MQTLFCRKLKMKIALSYINNLVKSKVSILCATVFFVLTISQRVHSHIDYLVSAPAVFRSGITQNISVRIFHHEEAVLVNATVMDWRGKVILATKVANIKTIHSGKCGTCFIMTRKWNNFSRTRYKNHNSVTLTVLLHYQIPPISYMTFLSINCNKFKYSLKFDYQGVVLIPKGKAGKAILQVCGNCIAESEFQFQNSTTITILNKSFSVFIQTDKPIYRPQQRVFLGIYMVDRELRPISEKMTVYIKNPSDIKVTRWKNLLPTCCGVINSSFLLTDQPILGTWHIFVEVRGMLYNETFEVQKYVLPKFKVTIVPPTTFQNFTECQEASVTAEYTFGKPVKGSLLLNTTVLGLGYFKREMDEGHTAVRKMQLNGEARFFICVQDNLGRKNLNRHFRGALSISATVTSEDGSQVTAYDDTTVVSRVLVELEFAEDTRKHFKPGIAFQGQLNVRYLNGTGAENVLIQLKVEDQNGVIITQELLSFQDGVILYTVPPHPKTTEFIWLQAKVIAINGISTRHEYLSVYKYLHTWYSPSNCYMYAQPLDHEAMAGKYTNILIKSTCPCNFTLLYDVLSRGDIVKSGSMVVKEEETKLNYVSRLKRPAPEMPLNSKPFLHLSNDKAYFEMMNTCEAILPIMVTPNMAPISKVLMYYLKDDGEGVADSIELPVKFELENKVSVEILDDDSKVKPGHDITLAIDAEEGSCVCFSIVDSSLHIIKPDYFLTQDEINEEIRSYDMNNLPFDDDQQWRSVSRKRKKRSVHGHRNTKIRDSFYAFLETGLVVMTNAVILDHKQSMRVFSERHRQALMQNAIKYTTRKPRRIKVRSYKPETWYWKCFNMTTARKNLTLKVPDTITSWNVNAISMDTNSGIGISRPSRLTTFKDLFIEFTLPYSAIRDEQFLVPLTIHNYLNICIEAHVTIALPPGISFGTQTSSKVRHICVAPQSAHVIHYSLKFSKLGWNKILAAVIATDGSTKCCSERKVLLPTLKENVGEEHTPSISEKIVGDDAVRATILIKAEGEPREYTHSVFFCPSEIMTIAPTPPSVHRLWINENKKYFIFLAKGQENIHILLESTQSSSSPSYVITIGGDENTKTWIEENNRLLNSTVSENILSLEEYRAFWISWSNSIIAVGHGTKQREASEILRVDASAEVMANIIGLKSSGQSIVEFRLWGRNESSDGFREALQLNVPKNAIPGSVKGFATLIGDVMGPTLKNLHNLLKLPYGCGEQNIINFAPNTYILKYLKRTNQLTNSKEMETLKFVQQGYQRQLIYKRSNGSYSSFGNRDQFGSMWLTAFVLKTYSEARNYIFIDKKELHGPLHWILSHQAEDGHFPTVGKILNKDVHAGKAKKISLSAYVAIAILEKGIHSENEEKAVKKTLEYLENMDYGFENPYSVALTAYALTLGGSRFAHNARQTLLDMSLTSASGSYRYWSLKNYMDAEEMVYADILDLFPDTANQTVASAEVEIASYALLAFTKIEDISTALPIVRWISKQRNSQGGFSSTQDTCIALQALSAYAAIAHIGPVNMKVTMEADNYFWDVALNETNSDVLQVSNLASWNRAVVTAFVTASGEGCALLQATVQYNIPKVTGKKAFELRIKMFELYADKEEKDPDDWLSNNDDQFSNIENEPTDKLEMEACMRWTYDGSSNMAVLEISLLTGLIPDTESLENLMSNHNQSLKRYEIKGTKIIFYFDEIPSICKLCVRFNVIQKFFMENAKPQVAKLYDYYEPGFQTTVFYERRRYSTTLNGNQINGLTTQDVEFDDSYSMCKCYKDCGYEGVETCGTDGVLYLNQCRLDIASCESENSVQMETESDCMPQIDDIFPDNFPDNPENEYTEYSYTY